MRALQNLAHDDPENGAGLLRDDLDVDGTIARYAAICAARFPNADRAGWGEAARIAVRQLRQLQGIEPMRGRQLRSGPAPN